MIFWFMFNVVFLYLTGNCRSLKYCNMIRFMHERLRTHAESIAFFGGGAREKAVYSLYYSGLY